MIGCVHASDHVLYRSSAVALPHAGLQRLPVALSATSSAANIGRCALLIREEELVALLYG